MFIYFIVTNDLSYDQRMIRICSSLAKAGFTIQLVGRKLKNSIPLLDQPFQQKRLNCFFVKGKWFYCEYNIRVFFYLLYKKMDCICAIDLDTILPCYFISRIKKVERVYDAHELFCEMKEIVSRPGIYKIWKRIEKFSVPKFTNGYTVSKLIADEFNKMYNVNYIVIRNMTVKQDLQIPDKKKKYVLYQGAVNEGRCFETLIPAMKHVNASMIICGNGNFKKKAVELVSEHQLNDKIIFKGYLSPQKLMNYSLAASVGINLGEDTSLSNYYSLTNRFFDYMHAGLPQLCMDYPAYKEINDQFKIAILITDTSAENIAKQINNLLEDETLNRNLHQNCMLAKEIYNWQNEEKILIGFYKSILAG